MSNETTKPSESKTYSLPSESSTTLVNSGTPSKPHNRPVRRKNYEAALGALQSRYGVGGNVPSPKPPGDASNKLTLPLHMQLGSSRSAETVSSSTTLYRSQSAPFIDPGKKTGPVQSDTAPQEGTKKSVFGGLLKGPKKM